MRVGVDFETKGKVNGEVPVAVVTVGEVHLEIKLETEVEIET